MKIKQVMDSLSQILESMSFNELMPFPLPLEEYWSHPDLFLSLAGRKPNFVYVFQHVKPGEFLEKLEPTPQLIALFDKVGSTLPETKLFQFLSEVSKIASKDNPAYFEVQAINKRPYLRDTQCLTWIIFMEGVPCGKLFLYTALPGNKLPESGRLLLHISPAALASALTIQKQEDDLCDWETGTSSHILTAPVSWMRIPQMLNIKHALQALVPSVDDENMEVSDSPVQTSLPPASEFSDLFAIYNANSRKINLNESLYRLFVERLKTLTQKLLSAKSPGI